MGKGGGKCASRDLISNSSRTPRLPAKRLEKPVESSTSASKPSSTRSKAVESDPATLVPLLSKNESTSASVAKFNDDDGIDTNVTFDQDVDYSPSKSGKRFIKESSAETPSVYKAANVSAARPVSSGGRSTDTVEPPAPASSSSSGGLRKRHSIAASSSTKPVESRSLTTSSSFPASGERTEEKPLPSIASQRADDALLRGGSESREKVGILIAELPVAVKEEPRPSSPQGPEASKETLGENWEIISPVHPLKGLGPEWVSVAKPSIAETSLEVPAVQGNKEVAASQAVGERGLKTPVEPPEVSAKALQVIAIAEDTEQCSNISETALTDVNEKIPFVKNRDIKLPSKVSDLTSKASPLTEEREVLSTLEKEAPRLEKKCAQAEGVLGAQKVKEFDAPQVDKCAKVEGRVSELLSETIPEVVRPIPAPVMHVEAPSTNKVHTQVQDTPGHSNEEHVCASSPEFGAPVARQHSLPKESVALGLLATVQEVPVIKVVTPLELKTAEDSLSAENVGTLDAPAKDVISDNIRKPEAFTVPQETLENIPVSHLKDIILKAGQQPKDTSVQTNLPETSNRTSWRSSKESAHSEAFPASNAVPIAHPQTAEKDVKIAELEENLPEANSHAKDPQSPDDPIVEKKAEKRQPSEDTNQAPPASPAIYAPAKEQLGPVQDQMDRLPAQEEVHSPLGKAPAPLNDTPSPDLKGTELVSPQVSVPTLKDTLPCEAAPPQKNRANEQPEPATNTQPPVPKLTTDILEKKEQPAPCLQETNPPIQETDEIGTQAIKPEIHEEKEAELPQKERNVEADPALVEEAAPAVEGAAPVAEEKDVPAGEELKVVASVEEAPAAVEPEASPEVMEREFVAPDVAGAPAEQAPVEVEVAPGVEEKEVEAAAPVAEVATEAPEAPIEEEKVAEVATEVAKESEAAPALVEEVAPAVEGPAPVAEEKQVPAGEGLKVVAPVEEAPAAVESEASPEVMEREFVAPDVAGAPAEEAPEEVEVAPGVEEKEVEAAAPVAEVATEAPEAPIEEEKVAEVAPEVAKESEAAPALVEEVAPAVEGLPQWLRRRRWLEVGGWKWLHPWRRPQQQWSLRPVRR